MDILKLVVVLFALLYFCTVIRPHTSKLNYWIIVTGLLLLLFASVLDFTDDIQILNYIPILGWKARFHDILEDQIGDTLGLALFAFGVFREIIRKSTDAKCH